MTNNRILPDWLQSYETYTSNIPGSQSFYQWSALTMLGATIAGKVQIFEGSNAIHPNLMTLFVDPSSAGKSTAVNTAETLFRTACQLQSDIQICDYNNTLRAVIQEVTTTFDTYHSIVFSEEANILFNTTKHKQIGRIIKMYNSGRLSILTAIQSNVLKHVFQKSLFDLGFMARIHIVTTSKVPIPKAFNANTLDLDLRTALEHDLRMIMNLSEETQFSEKAAIFIDRWWIGESNQSQLRHPLLFPYNRQRLTHLLRLSLLCSVSRTNSLIIRKRDVIRALEILTSNEKLLALIVDRIWEKVT